MASLIAEGIVTSLEILGVNQEIGNRGSKPDSYISVKEQRVDGFSVFKKYRKVYSKCQGNLVFIYHINYVNQMVQSIRQIKLPILKGFALSSHVDYSRAKANKII